MAIRYLFAALSEDPSERYDLLLTQLGYESRAVHVTNHLDGRFDQLVAMDYVSPAVLSYVDNKTFFERLGNIIDPAATGVRSLFEATLFQLASALGKEEIRLAIDISSCDRQRLSEIVLALTTCAMHFPVVVDFYYSVGKFDEAHSQIDEPVMVNEALRGYEGWTTDPDRPLTCILGVGFERQFALAALETLEPRQTVVFVGDGPDARYRAQVDKDNESLLNSRLVAVVGYDVALPLSTLRQLDVLVRATRASQRIAVVPLGSKVFALAAILVGAMYPEDVAVWRVSAGQSREAQDRAASGPIVGLRLRVSAQ